MFVFPIFISFADWVKRPVGTIELVEAAATAFAAEATTMSATRVRILVELAKYCLSTAGTAAAAESAIVGTTMYCSSLTAANRFGFRAAIAISARAAKPFDLSDAPHSRVS